MERRRHRRNRADRADRHQLFGARAGSNVQSALMLMKMRGHRRAGGCRMDLGGGKVHVTPLLDAPTSFGLIAARSGRR